MARLTNWTRTELGRLGFWLLLMVLGLVGALLLIAGLAHGHGSHITPAQEAWLERQRARDGMKCCDVRDVHVGEDVEWRLAGKEYEVRIGGQWRRVPPGRVLALREGDPSPFGHRALLFHATWGSPPEIYCFLPEPLM